MPQAAGIGNIVTSFPTGFTGGYGLAYDTDSNRLWVSNSDAPSAGLTGDGVDYEYLADGTQTGETIALQPGVWQGDGTYNARTGMIWQVNVAYRVGSGYQCLFEIDPVARAVTGKQICGPWGDFPAQVGLAYDYATDTYYVGDQLGTILHIDNAGNLLDSGHVTMQISGLAYNPTTRHLFVESFSPPFDVYVLDPSQGYAILSGSYVTSDGVPGARQPRRQPGGRLQRPPLDLRRVQQRGLRVRVGRDAAGASTTSRGSRRIPTTGTIPGAGGGALPRASATRCPSR